MVASYSRVLQTMKDRYVSSLELLQMSEGLVAQYGTEKVSQCSLARLAAVAEEYKGILESVFAVSPREIRELEEKASAE